MSGRRTTRQRRRPGRGRPAPADGGAIVTVCRGCCCGTAIKHPDVDHDTQLAQLRAGVGATGAQIRIVDCLDACDRSNVVVLTPSPAARRAGARPVWLGKVLDTDTDTVAEIVSWVRAGGPGDAAAPASLDMHVFSPSRRVRQATEGRP